MKEETIENVNVLSCQVEIRKHSTEPHTTHKHVHAHTHTHTPSNWHTQDAKEKMEEIWKSEQKLSFYFPPI